VLARPGDPVEVGGGTTARARAWNAGAQAEATCARAFDPFFTTKAKDHGGLGLAMVHAIIKRRGSVIVDSVFGTGTTFQIWLPTAS
jgi:C4-dicarboxylate-specific signal transduction histidine kinase